MATLSELRARLQAAENKQQSAGSGEPSAIYPHWNLQDGQSTTLRFLPDADPKNDFFWIERAQIRLPFNGIKGQGDSKQVIIPVPCVETWGETCPILTEVRTWFKDKSLEELGRKYWKKRSYIMQGFVRENPLTDDKAPENPIRRFIIGPQIFTLIKGALMDPELEELPTDYLRGLDFRITKGSKGGFADYNSSKWARKESALSAEEQAAIDQYGLFNLADFLPKKPTAEELRVISEMFEASVDGKAYDLERWGNYYRPSGVAAPAGSGSGSSEDDAPRQSAPVSTPAPAVQESSPFRDDEDEGTASASSPVQTSAPSGGSQKAQDILAMIKARQSQQ